MQHSELRPSALKEIQNVAGASTQRSWERTKNLLELDEFDCDGTVILDLGSGLRATSPDVDFPGARVCAVDPLFAVEGQQPYADGLSLEQLQSYQGAGIPISIDHTQNLAHERRIGVAQRIPYRANTFDLVMSTFSFPMCLDDEDIGRGFSEVVRVTKPGGQVRIWSPGLKDSSDPTITSVIQVLEQQNIGVSFSEFGLMTISVPKIGLKEKNNLWKQLYRALRTKGLISPLSNALKAVR